MNPKLLRESEWDDAVHQASEDYKHQMVKIQKCLKDDDDDGNFLA